MSALVTEKVMIPDDELSETREEGEMSDELKPCPFCGGPANESTERVGISTWLTFVKCWSCAFDMQMSKWNRRPIEDALRAELEALRKWEVRVTRSMDEASAAAGVEYCDAVPKAIHALRAEIDALREVVRAADDMRARSSTYRGLTQSMDRYDAARAKVMV